MQIETLHDLWNSGARLYARYAWGRREGLKSVRACIGNVELDVGSANIRWTCLSRLRPFSRLVGDDKATIRWVGKGADWLIDFQLDLNCRSNGPSNIHRDGTGGSFLKEIATDTYKTVRSKLVETFSLGTGVRRWNRSAPICSGRA
jgi:hypothetical protein